MWHRDRLAYRPWGLLEREKSPLWLFNRLERTLVWTPFQYCSRMPLCVNHKLLALAQRKMGTIYYGYATYENQSHLKNYSRIISRHDSESLFSVAYTYQIRISNSCWSVTEEKLRNSIHGLPSFSLSTDMKNDSGGGNLKMKKNFWEGRKMWFQFQ